MDCSKTIRKAMLALSAGALLSLGAAQTTDDLLDPAPENWPSYNRTMDNQRFSPLDQVTSENVDELGLAWSRSLGFDTDAQFSPVVYEGVMYINGADRVQALDAATGELIWEYTTELDENAGFLTAGRSRGSVALFEGDVFHALGDGRVVALDGATGEELWSTQVGQIEYGEGFSSGPIIADGKIIVGPSGADAGGVPGRVLALDRESGEILWTFNTVPQPGEPGFETWDPPTSAEWGGGSAWNVGAYDPETGSVVYGIGQPSPWGNFEVRGSPSPDLYTASWVALDVDSGELKWYHQAVPGDEWDFDQIATPTFADLEIEGETRRTAILPTTTGFLVLVDSETGEFLDAHQMHPDVTVHTGYEEDGTPIINDDARFEEPGVFKEICPGIRWVDFEPASYDPNSGIYFRPNTHECTSMAAAERPADWQPGQSPQSYTLEAVEHEYERLGGLTAVDPVTGEELWDFGHGYSQRSGTVATAGGVVFMGSPDRHFRAFDSETGEVLFDQVLPAYIQANPITYAVDGRQYVAIPVGGTGSLVINRLEDEPPLVPSDVSVFVFTLPE